MNAPTDDIEARLRAKRSHEVGRSILGEFVNPDGPEAADRISELRGALEKIAACDFNCTPRQYYIAMIGIAQAVLEGSGK